MAASPPAKGPPPLTTPAELVAAGQSLLICPFTKRKDAKSGPTRAWTRPGLGNASARQRPCNDNPSHANLLCIVPMRQARHFAKSSATGTRTRVARVRAEYPNQLDYSGSCLCSVAFQWLWRVRLLWAALGASRGNPSSPRPWRLASGSCPWPGRASPTRVQVTARTALPMVGRSPALTRPREANPCPAMGQPLPEPGWRT